MTQVVPMPSPSPSPSSASSNAPAAARHRIGADRTGDTSSAPAVRLDGVTAGYDGRAALENVSIQIDAGSLVAILGPNGGGKTTLLKVVAGLLRPWRGTVEVLGAPAGQQARRVAYVPQAESVDWSFPVSVCS